MPIVPHNPKQPPVFDAPGPKSASILHKDVGALFKAGYTPKAPFKELSVFSRKLSFLLGAGVPIKTALSIVSEQMPGRGLRKLLPGLASKVEQGESFSAAIQGTGAFPAFFCGFIGIGEATATLPQVLEQLAGFYDDRAQTRDELTAALVYPIVVSIMMLGVIMLAVVFVLPGYSRIFAATGTPLPALTRNLMQVSDFFVANMMLVVGVLFALPVIVIVMARSARGREVIAAVELWIPLARMGVNFRLAQSLQLLLSAGLPVSRALPLVEDVMHNIHVRRDLSKISAQMGAGKSFWEILSQVKYIDPLLVGMAKVGEESGLMPHAMEKCRDYCAHAYKQAIRRFSKLVEPIITLVLGVGLGIIMLAVILPTFELATVM